MRVYDAIGRSPYGPIATPFEGASDEIMPVCLGPISKLIGPALQLHQDGGRAWGTFESRYCDAGDAWAGCTRDNVAVATRPSCPSLGSYEACQNCRGTAVADRILTQVPTSEYAFPSGTRYPYGVLP